jgi:hypothetical protein
MSLSSIKNKITNKVGREILVAQKHSPAILVGASVVGVAATVILACRATLKLEEVLKEAEDKDAQIEGAKALDSDEYTTEDAKKDGLTVRVQTAVKIAKLYAPAAVVGILTVGAMTGSHIIMNRRNLGLTAAYAALDKGFKDYRARVVEELGEDKDREFRVGVVERQMAVETDSGTDVKTVKVADPKTFEHGHSIYAKIFDESNRNWQRQYSYNAMFLRSQQNYANDILKSRGHLFLNEVYAMLGLDHTRAGAVVGWVKGNGDSYVDFGITDTYDGMRFVNGDERSVWLDFNVDGVVYDLLKD